MEHSWVIGDSYEDIFYFIREYDIVLDMVFVVYDLEDFFFLFACRRYGLMKFLSLKKIITSLGFCVKQNVSSAIFGSYLLSYTYK